MAKLVSAKTLLSKHVRRKDHVLLVNPPVEETRYSWIRWNQPLDLLKLGSVLRSEIGCGVSLFDSMLPDAKGEVPEQWLPKDRRYYDIGGHRYPMRRFGRPYGHLTDWLTAERHRNGKSLPTQVWITSLCSYWYESVAQLCRSVREALPDAQVVLLGQYPRLMPEHAARSCAADLIVSKPADLADQPAAFDLYGERRPPFLALQLDAAASIADARAAVAAGIYAFAFFDDDICRDGGEPLAEIVRETRGLHKHLRYHAICGLNPQRVTASIARTIATKNFAELHFEEADEGASLDDDAYARATAYLREAGLAPPSDRLSGFVWVGRPRDDLEELIRRSFRVLESFGSLILKPYTPTPDGDDARRHARYLAGVLHRDWSPHFFPFAELNGITRDEYHDLYRMAAFLNEKVRNRAFDFLRGTLGAEMLHDSLRREVWNLEPSPLRIAD